MTNVLDSLGRIKIVTGSGGNVWPKADKVNIGTTEYPTFAASVAALVSGDNPIVGEGTYSSSNLTISTDGELVGSGTQASLVSNSLSGFQQLTITATNYIIRQLKFAVTATTDSDISALILGGASKTHRLKNVEILHDATGIVGAVGQCVKLASMSNATVELQDCYLRTITTTGSVYTLKTSTNGTVIINGGLYDGKLFIDNGATVKFINLPQITGTVTITAGATVTGPYLDGSGNVIFPNAVGQSGGVWLYKADGLRVKYADYDNAYTAAGTGDTIYFFNGAYSFSANKAVGKSIIIEGQSAQGVTITNSVANSSAFDVTADNVTFRNLTIVSTGASTSTGCISTDNANLIIENCILNKSSGAATTGYALWMYGGTATIINSVLSSTSGTAQYGLYNTTAATTVTVRGGSIGGATDDILSDQSGAVITLNSVVLTNGLVSCSGTLNWMPEAKVVKNLLYSSLTHNLWSDATLNDLADDTYGPDDIWNVLNKDNAPDISAQSGGSTDPFSTYFRCTFDSNSAQAGIVQFLEFEDTYPLRGQVVSLSADLWGTNISTLRMAVIIWTSTADTLTSDVVGTWSTGNPTLATNWAYIGTPAAITITSTRTRFAVNNLLVPTNANNLGVFIWTDAAESSGDLWNVARVQLERGPVATEFTARLDVEESIRVRHFYERLGTVAQSIFVKCYQAAGSTIIANVSFIPKRIAVTPTVVGTWATENVTGSVTALAGSVNTGTLYVTATATASTAFYTNGGYLALDARL